MKKSLFVSKKSWKFNTGFTAIEKVSSILFTIRSVQSLKFKYLWNSTKSRKYVNYFMNKNA